MMRKAISLFLALLCLLPLLPEHQSRAEEIRGYQEGIGYQYVQFGEYFTEADGKKSPILWRVLRAKDGKAELLSEYILFGGPVHGDNDHYPGWAKSDLYRYLNGTFKDDAFSAAQQAALLPHPEDQGLVTLLSSDEMKSAALGFAHEKDRQCESTAWAKIKHDPPLWELPKNNKKVTWKKLNVFAGKKKYSPWWSRTVSADHPKEQRRVVEGGKIGRASVGYSDQGARPLITLDLSKVAILSGNGTLSSPFLLQAEEGQASKAIAAPKAKAAATAAPAATKTADSTAPKASPASTRKPLVATQQKNQNTYLIEGENRLIARPPHYPTKTMKKLVAAFNTAIDALGENRPPIYVYLAESSRSHYIDWTFDPDSKAYKYLTTTLHADYFDHLKYSTYEEYCNYFYSTDHHWNYKGSYQGYVDVVRMMFGEDEEVLVPVETVETSVIFNGSFTNKLKIPISTEKFAFYRFDPFPKYTAYQYGKARPYDHINDVYMKGKYKKGTYANHYAHCYGGNAGLMTFESDCHKERTLLLFGNSLSNPLKFLLTQHFGKIVYVDPRFYKGQVKKDFSLSEAVKKYDINYILFVGDAYLFVIGDEPLP